MQNTYTPKHILVTGGVISGVGKGVLASSIGTILKIALDLSYCATLFPEQRKEIKPSIINEPFDSPG